jgi:hypothetical protein
MAVRIAHGVASSRAATPNQSGPPTARPFIVRVVSLWPRPAVLPAASNASCALSSDARHPGKLEMDLSLPSEPSCVEGVPKGLPDGEPALLFPGSYRTFITEGSGPDCRFFLPTSKRSVVRRTCGRSNNSIAYRHSLQ